MLLFSGYLMNVMFSEFVFGGLKLGAGGICPFCLFSAITATAMFVLVLLGKEWDERGPLFSIGAIVALLTLVGTLAVYAPQKVVAGGTVTDGQGKVIYAYSTTSGDSEKQLAKHLKDTGAIMYGAYTCSHCCAQKVLFGQEAVASELPYVECAPGGKNPQTEVCQKELDESAKQAGGRAGFPTWKVNGKYLTGEQPLASLAQASNYKGPQDFKNQRAECTPQ